MEARFSQRFPAVTGDLGSIWSCQNEIRNRSRQIGELYTGVNAVISRCIDWEGQAKDAFINSANVEKREIGIWEDGTLQAANALKSYYFTLEWVIGSVNGIRARADELWEQYQAMTPADRAMQEASIKEELSYLQKSYDDAKNELSNQALNTAASLREALYFTPEDVHKAPSQGEKEPEYEDYGDTRSLTEEEFKDILARLEDPSSSLFDINQGRIGDCHLMASLNAYNQTEAGRRYLASLITPHYGADGKVDGFYVDFPGFGRDRKRVFVQDILEYGDAAMVPSGSLSALTMTDISGKLTAPIPLTNSTNGAAMFAAIAAVNTGKPVVAESGLVTGSADVTVGGEPKRIQVSPSHAYTVVGADGNGVTLTNPWGKNLLAGTRQETGATFTMSWRDFHANFGDVTVGRVP